MTETNGSRLITVKNWHVVLTLLAWLVISVANFVSTRAETEHNTREIEELKRDHVTKDRFETQNEEIQRRLQRIEDKLDRDRAIRSLH